MCVETAKLMLSGSSPVLCYFTVLKPNDFILTHSKPSMFHTHEFETVSHLGQQKSTGENVLVQHIRKQILIENVL